MINISRLDHLVLTVANIDKTVHFYETILGMEKVTFGEGRVALNFGQQKINLHQSGAEIDPKASQVQVGSADLCFITTTPVVAVLEHMKQQRVTIIEGPVRRTGAMGPIESVYCRDPDGNLLEVANYLE